MDASQVYAQLQEACRVLEEAQEYAAAAHVAHAMALVQQRFDVGQDHLAQQE